ncbi:MAG: hypothetical protein ACREK5_03725 [Gemmatimonadota bacterium]
MHEAKARFSELFRRVRTGGGDPVVVHRRAAALCGRSRSAGRGRDRPIANRFEDARTRLEEVWESGEDITIEDLRLTLHYTVIRRADLRGPISGPECHEPDPA